MSLGSRPLLMQMGSYDIEYMSSIRNQLLICLMSNLDFYNGGVWILIIYLDFLILAISVHPKIK